MQVQDQVGLTEPMVLVHFDTHDDLMSPFAGDMVSGLERLAYRNPWAVRNDAFIVEAFVRGLVSEVVWVGQDLQPGFGHMVVGSLHNGTSGEPVMSPQQDPALGRREVVWCFCLTGALDGFQSDSESGCYYNSVPWIGMKSNPTPIEDLQDAVGGVLGAALTCKPKSWPPHMNHAERLPITIISTTDSDRQPLLPHFSRVAAALRRLLPDVKP